jgi:hypothetical protein
MPEPQEDKDATLSTAQHPATRAWCHLTKQDVIPESVKILQERVRKVPSPYRQTGQPRHRGYYEASSIYRLVGVGPGRANVIAKRCEVAAASRECVIYENVLPYLAASTPRYYGLIADEDQQFCWLFLEDAGEERYSLDLEDHRVLAGHWLGVMNVSAHQLPAAVRLPDRGAGFYLELLLASRETIRETVENSRFNDADLAVLRAHISHCDALEERWNEVERFCNRLPRTLVHGDFSVQNARLRISAADNSLLIMDWEGAGWGIPAADLAQFVGQALNPDIRAYHSVVSLSWLGIELADLERLARLGRMFRLISALDWANWGLRAVGAEWYMEKMLWCEPELAGWLRAAEACGE